MTCRGRDQSAGTMLVLVILLAAIVAAAMARAAWRRPVGAPGTRVGDCWPALRVDVNSASATELSLLPGVGPRLADRIVADRLHHGPFGSVGDLQRVAGIGPRTVERWSGLAKAGGATAERRHSGYDH